MGPRGYSGSSARTHAETVQYFLETEQDELEYEAARRRPLLTPDFFAQLTQAIGEERFSSTSNAGRLAELERLQEFLQAAVAAVDATVAARSAPAERLRRLLSAPDKKATLLQMAGDGEIDRPLLDLLQQNIEAANGAGQAQAAEFMSKVRAAAMKFLITT
ncbi:hypothetical protein WJX81_006953 [Elliptochloris bilobata]|uniref:Uncharacterized protein n=1 Tax=Elliptochloris bilobata TaxID=381761 RepID=A0AAW1RK29_9CHLO